MNNFKEILNELSYRVSSGIPDLRNEQHLIKLWDILKEHNWSIDARVELLKRLDEQGKERLCPICEAQCQQGQNPGRDNCVAASGAKGTGKSAQGDEEPTDKPTKAPTEEQRKQQRQTDATKNADKREKVDLTNLDKKEKKAFKAAKVDPIRMSKELSGDPLKLDSLVKITEHTQDLRAGGGPWGAGGPVASEGESKFTQANNEMKKDSNGESQHDKFKEDNKDLIAEKKEKFKSKDKLPKDQRDTLRQLGFEEPYADEAFDYLATREAWGESKFTEIKADKDSVYYKKFGGNKKPRPTKAGKAQDDWDAKEKLATEKYMSWMDAAYDGAISTQAHLEGSRLDTSKDHVVSQATPEQDKVIEDALQKKYEEEAAKCGSGTKESCAKADHYARELKKWDEFKGFHDTYAIGQDKDGNMVYIPISNKKGSSMRDPQNNTTPAQRLSFIKKQFGPGISKNVETAMDKGIDETSRARATTIEDTANLPITDEVVKEFESERFTKYRLDLDEQATSRAKPTKKEKAEGKLGKKKPLGKWLDSQKPPVDWNDPKLTSKEKLELMQKFSKEKLFDGETSRIRYDDDGNMMYKEDGKEERVITGLGSIGLRYNTFGKLGIKFGEFGASEDAIALKEKESAVVKKVHKDVTTTLFDEDEPDGYRPDDDERKDADNGENVQAYISGVLKAVHADTYIDMEDDEDYDVLVQMGVNGVRPSHIRECLAEKSGFEGDINAPGGRDALKEHLRKKCRIKPGEDKVSVVDSGGKSTELFNDQWRTAGAGQQKIATHFGKGMIDCMTKKVQK